jgi:hypothetical protein
VLAVGVDADDVKPAGAMAIGGVMRSKSMCCLYDFVLLLRRNRRHRSSKPTQPSKPHFNKDEDLLVECHHVDFAKSAVKVGVNNLDFP